MKLHLPAPASRPDVLVVAGEHSGDEHGAGMVRDFLRMSPGKVVCALGGPRLAEAGAQLLFDLTASSVVGLVEVIRNLSFFRALHADILRWIAEHRPRAVCFIDYPGLNLRLAEAMRGRGLSRAGGGAILTLFYISPQIWAWKGDRRFTMARDLDAMAVIFPFEVESYRDTILPVEFVGHPFVAPGVTLPVAYDPAGPVLLLLAGHRAFGARPAVVLYPSARIRAELQSLLPAAHPAIELRPVGDIPTLASAVLTSSGTMSMQCALAGIPGAIAYRANPITYVLGRLLVSVPYLGIANLLLGRPMYPEYIQGDATPKALAAELNACVHEPARRAQTARDAVLLREILSAPAAGSSGEWLAKMIAAAAGTCSHG
jgi:lipid-A-disaccharide synthase